MRQSLTVEVDGVFVGAAIATGTGFRFHAVHAGMAMLDESRWHSLEALRHGVRRVCLGTGGLPRRTADPLTVQAGRGRVTWTG